MRKYALSAFVATLLIGQANSQTWQLSWSDEFSYTGALDTTKWNIEVNGNPPNGEAEYYTNSQKNVHVDSGSLYITALKQNMGSQSYTSGRINTENKEVFLYGRFEIRAKVPGGQGSWPAFWSLGDSCNGQDSDHTWPNCGEIDIAEYKGSDANVMNSNLHMQDLNYLLDNNPHGDKTLAAVADSFHVYALEWFPDHISTYYDTSLILTYKNPNPKPGTNDHNYFGTWPYYKPQHIIINEALGGGYGGTISNSIFPTSWVIQYLRVYKWMAPVDIRPVFPHLKFTAVAGLKSALYDLSGRKLGAGQTAATLPVLFAPASPPRIAAP